MKSIQQYNILIVCALGQESQIVKSILKGHIFQGIRFHYHICGVGSEKSMISLTQFLSTSDIVFDLVINIGLSGYARVVGSEGSLRGKLIQSLRIFQGDVKKELCVPPQYIIDDVPILPLTSRYRVVRDPRQLDYFLQYDDLIAVDMEGYSIEYVCDIFRYPRLFLKILYDEIEKDNIKDHEDMVEVMKKSLDSLPELLKKIL